MNDEVRVQLVRRGRPPADERTCSVTTNLPPKLYQNLLQLAQKNRESLSQTVRKQLERSRKVL